MQFVDLQSVVEILRQQIWDLPHLQPGEFMEQIEPLIGSGVEVQLVLLMKQMIQQYFSERAILKYLHIVDKLIKIPGFSNQLAGLIVDIYVDVFMGLWMQRCSSELDELKIIRKLWVQAVHPALLDQMRVSVLARTNIDIETGFRVETIRFIKDYYERTLRLSPPEVQYYLPQPSSEGFQAQVYKVNDYMASHDAVDSPIRQEYQRMQRSEWTNNAASYQESRQSVIDSQAPLFNQRHHFGEGLQQTSDGQQRPFVSRHLHQSNKFSPGHLPSLAHDALHSFLPPTQQQFPETGLTLDFVFSPQEVAGELHAHDSDWPEEEGFGLSRKRRRVSSEQTAGFLSVPADDVPKPRKVSNGSVWLQPTSQTPLGEMGVRPDLFSMLRQLRANFECKECGTHFRLGASYQAHLAQHLRVRLQKLDRAKKGPRRGNLTVLGWIEEDESDTKPFESFCLQVGKSNDQCCCDMCREPLQKRFQKGKWVYVNTTSVVVCNRLTIMHKSCQVCLNENRPK